LSTYNSINLNYAKKISQKRWMKFGVDFYGSYELNEPITQAYYPNSDLNFSTTFLIGLDRHKSIKSNFELISGFNIRFVLESNFSKVENPSLPIDMRNTSTFNLYYGLGAAFGLYYKISDFFSIGSSINPILLYETNSTVTNTTTSCKMNLTNTSIISLRYKF